MRNTQRIICLVITFIAGAVSFTSAQRGAEESPKPGQFVGKWSGTWDGAGSGGGFELTLEQVKDAPLTGKVAVTGEPAYTATLKSVTFDGKKMKASYDFTPDEAAEVLLAASFDGNKATGTWTLRAKAGEAEVASGSWTVTRVGAVREPPK
jgi:hypothetical protein